MKKFKKITTKILDLSYIQSNVSQKFDNIDLCPFLDGNMVTNAVVTNAAQGTIINHGLGRIPLGWFATDKTAAGDIWRLAWDDRTVTLKSSAASTTINFWIF